MAFRTAEARCASALLRCACAALSIACGFGALYASAQADGALGPAPTEQFVADAERALSRDGASTNADSACPAAPLAQRVHCLLALRYQGSARELALRLYDAHGNVAGVEAAYTMNGGFRGRIQIVPEWPTRKHERHLRAIARAHDAIERTLAGLRAKTTQPVRYRHRGIVYRFCRSVGRTTPSAYAADWTIGYNVLGSLNKNDDAILTTLVHEIFHLNDQDDGFSNRELSTIHAAISARCGTARRCLAPYSPTATTVRGGTYYAFQKNNGDAVDEYGAELASRYLQEQRAMLESGKLARPAFKCATPENAQAWLKIGAAFFGGADLTPGC